jgi:hypothetical protein
MVLKTSVGQISAQVPQALHFFLSKMGGISSFPPSIYEFQNDFIDYPLRETRLSYRR